jgi:GNAT superfamily N-acetyltransferase
MNIPKIRPFMDSDAEVLHQLIYQTIDDAYTGVYGPKAIQYFKDYHSSSQILDDARQGQTMVLELNERIVGTGTICEQNIRRVFISPAFQGRSFGRMVMETLEKKALLMGLHHLNLDASLSSQDFGKEFGLKWVEGRRPWEVPCDIAVPTATQNELELDDARNLINNGCRCVVEAANMPCSPDAVDMLQDAGLLFAPGKAANAGGVAVSGLEMCQNSQHYCWSAEEVDCKLQQIMKKIHEQCVTFGSRGNSVNYVDGANIAGFVKVADAMLAQGII